MINILLMGHGKFASGICTTLKLLIGSYDKLIPIDFTQEMSPNNLVDKMKVEIGRLPKNNGLIIFTDIPGGTPFNKSVEYKLSHDNVEVIAGTNIPMLMEVLLLSESSLENVADIAIKFGQKGVLKFTEKKNKVVPSNTLGI